MRVMRVYRQADNQRVYTQAGWAYLGIWLAVLFARTAFLYALRTGTPSPRTSVGGWSSSNSTRTASPRSSC
jgi:hypothetical protein